MSDTGYTLDRESIDRLSQILRDDETKRDESDYGFGYPEGLESDSNLFAEIIASLGDGTYSAAQRYYATGSTSYDVPDSPIVWNAASEPGVLIETGRSNEGVPGSVVRVWPDTDESGNLAWFFTSPPAAAVLPPALCWGAWEITWEVATPVIAIEGEVNIADDYSEVSIHTIDVDGATRTPWLAAFKVGDTFKLGTEASGVGVYFVITESNLVGDFYRYNTVACDVSNKALITTGMNVRMCIALMCGDADDFDIEEGPGIAVLESPDDNWVISSLIEAGTCISLNDPAPGAAWEISVDLDCVASSIDWTSYIDVCDSIEWAESPDDCLHLVGDEPVDPLLDGYVYGDLVDRGWHLLRTYFDDTDSINWQAAGVGGGTEAVLNYDNSITVLPTTGAQLVGDVMSPPPWSFYGTDDASGGGDKGWQQFVEVTFITAMQLDGSDDLQVKTNTAWVANPGVESGFGTISGWTTTPCP